VPSPPLPPRVDPRVTRSLKAIQGAALELFSTRGTTDVTVREIAEAAGVSRAVVYAHYGNRAGLVMAVAAGLLEPLQLGREPVTSPADVERFFRLLAEHMAEHRAFYRAALSGPDGRSFTQDFDSYFARLDSAFVSDLYSSLEAEEAADLHSFLVGGTGTFFANWILTGPHPLDPSDFARRTARVIQRLLPTPASPKDRR
jgi:AcrR family transcriptional regulator